MTARRPPIGSSVAVTLRYLLNRTKAHVKRSPFLYRIAKHLKNRRAGEYLCNRSTDLCLEGYPSSANTFAFNLLLRLEPSLRMAHHCHTIANLKLAFAYGVPVVVLIRHPEEAVSSTVARFGGEVAQALAEYNEFHEFVRKNVERITIVRFEEVIDDTVAAVERIAGASGIRVDLSDLRAVKQDVLVHINEWSRKQGRSEQASAPRDDRESRKAPIRDQIRRSRRFRRAERLWREITAAGAARSGP